SFKLENINYNIAVLICYEIIFPAKVINGFRPDFIINLTNDAWYGDTMGPIQHLAAARVRAIEEGLPVIRAANTGISVVIDQYGQYIERLELGKEGVIDTNIPLSNLKTIFSKYGNYIYLISLIFMLMLVKFPFIKNNSNIGVSNE
ncbi:MAG: apolipoprotein N-acyltransferase, partial [Alphaproteobacteria bacterium]|nr:apolipoprotein N-acyltransferase [Alphaproteobacteria bacterium]